MQKNDLLLSVSAAREKMLQNISQLSSEKCSIYTLHNRIAAEDITALVSHPAEAVSSMTFNGDFPEAQRPCQQPIPTW